MSPARSQTACLGAHPPGRREQRPSISEANGLCFRQPHVVPTGSWLSGTGASVQRLSFNLTQPRAFPASHLLDTSCVNAGQTQGQLCKLPRIKNSERSAQGSPRISRVSTNTKYTELFAFSKFHTNIQKYLQLFNKGRGFAFRQGPPLQRWSCRPRACMQ